MQPDIGNKAQEVVDSLQIQSFRHSRHSIDFPLLLLSVLLLSLFCLVLTVCLGAFYHFGSKFLDLSYLNQICLLIPNLASKISYDQHTRRYDRKNDLTQPTQF